MSDRYDIDDFASDEEDGDFGFGEDDCGRWINGGLGLQCRLAGTEDCDWECPIGLPHRGRSAIKSKEE